MLGKGLESLIPPQNPKNSGGSNQDENKTTENEGLASNPPSQNNNLQDNSYFSDNKIYYQKLTNQKKHPPKGEAIFYIEVSKIKPNPHQPRKDFNEESINELANSIQQFGIIQPLVVTKIEKEVENGTEVEYQLIAGERRWLAAKKLGLETVPAIIKKIDVEEERLELAIIENIQRQNLNPIETARAFARLQDEFRLTQREIASRLGKSRETIANLLRLLDLPAYIQEAIALGKISESHGRLLLTISDPGLQKNLFEEMLKSNLTTRQLKEKINTINIKSSRGQNQSPKTVDPEIKMLEDKLKTTLGMPVKIHYSGESGKIIIEFYSEEELQNIINRLNLK